MLARSAARALLRKQLAVVGAGPGGYVAAIRAAQLGVETVCIEGRGALGGNCLNEGCIPSKSLLHTTHLLEESRTKFSKLGLEGGSRIVPNVGKIQKAKARAVTGLERGIHGLFKANGVELCDGFARLVGRRGDGWQLDVVAAADGSVVEEVHAEHVIVATGASPVDVVPGVADMPPVDHDRIVTSKSAIELGEAPARLAVIGGGIIGLELGSVWRRLGSKVDVIEFADRVVPPADAAVSAGVAKALSKQGLKLHTNTAVQGIELSADGKTVTVRGEKEGAPFELEADKLLLAVGRRPKTNRLNAAEAAGAALARGGFLRVDGNLRCVDAALAPIAGLYAIGDVCTPAEGPQAPMLAHRAEEDAVHAAEAVAAALRLIDAAPHAAPEGQLTRDYGAVPGVMYTDPEVAWVGQTEGELAAAGVAHRAATFSMMGNSRARANDRGTEGFVKVLVSDDEVGRLLGAHICAPAAGELIAPMVMAVKYGAAASDVAQLCLPHPALCEALKEACEAAAHGKAIHGM